MPASDFFEGGSGPDALASIAISLKRIADFLDPALATYQVMPDGTLQRMPLATIKAASEEG